MSPRRREVREEKVELLEKNVVRKSVGRGTVRIAVAYPSTYQVAMSSLSVHLLYFYLNMFDDIYAERVVMEGSGPYRSIETGTSLRDFDIVLFSVHYELDYVNIVRMLIESGINPLARERSLDEPVIIIGGPCVTANPEPLAEIADVIVVGEAEAVLDKLVEHIPDLLDRDFDALAEHEGFYVPKLGKHEVQAAHVEDMDSAFYPVKQIVTLEAPERFMPVFGRAFFLEVVRGCPFMCKFCMESYVQFPFRIRSYAKLVNILQKGLEHCPVDKVVLIGLGTQSHPEVKRLAEYILDELKLQVSFPSLRADKLDDEFLSLLARAGQEVLTIAPESSERVRYALGKDFSDEDVLKICERGVRAGLHHIKLYFIVGLPGEQPEDLRDCEELVKRLREKTRGQVYISVNPWIRKPQTPLQFFSPSSLEEVEKKLDVFSSLGVRHTEYDPVLGYAQMLLALGDRDVTELVLELANQRANPLSRAVWKRVFAQHGELLKKYVFRAYSPEEELPWSHVKLGLSWRTIVKKAEQYADMLGIRFKG